MSISSRSAGRTAAFSAKSSSRPRSRKISSRAVGRCTFITTRSPSSSRARCTWPMVPAASGSGSMLSKTSSHGTCSSCSITATTSAWVSGGTLSCRWASSSTNSCGSRPGRVDRIWPSLEKVGPSCSSASRSRLARSAVESVWPSARSARPYLPTMRPILSARSRSSPPASSVSSSSGSRTVCIPSVVLTMTTVQRALCEIRFGTLPSRNSLRPLMPAFPTTRTSAPSSMAASTIARGGSGWMRTRARPRSPASSRASSRRLASASAMSTSPFSAGITWTMTSSAP